MIKKIINRLKNIKKTKCTHACPAGKWSPESDHDSKQEAAERVAWLNGSNKK